MFLDGFFDGIVLKGFLPITLLMLMGKLVLYKVKWYLPFIIKKCGIFGHRYLVTIQWAILSVCKIEGESAYQILRGYLL